MCDVSIVRVVRWVVGSLGRWLVCFFLTASRLRGREVREGGRKAIITLSLLPFLTLERNKKVKE